MAAALRLSFLVVVMVLFAQVSISWTATLQTRNDSLMAAIVGGRETTPHSLPWQVQLRDCSGHTCGGSLIARRWVITAAHCTFSPMTYFVRLGAHRINDDGHKVVDRKVDRVIVHPDYRLSTDGDIVGAINDIQLLRLDKPVPLGEEINVVRLPRQGQRAPDGTLCYASGWGTTITGPRSALLQEVQVPIDESCGSVQGVDRETMICAGFLEGGKDTCNGDSGGPLVCHDESLHRYVLHGITSWGHVECGTPDFPGVYTRVAHYTRWIEGHTGFLRNPFSNSG